MTRMARIDGDGLVVETVNIPDELEIFQVFHPAIAATFHPAAAEVALGWNWDGSAFLAPSGPALDALKASMSATVNAKRDAVIAAGYQHNFGGSAGIRTLDQRGAEDAINWLGLKGVADAMIAAGNGSDPIAIRDAGDETFTSSATVVSSAMVAMGVWRSSVIAHSWALKDAVSSAGDKVAVDALDLGAGWPE